MPFPVITLITGITQASDVSWPPCSGGSHDECLQLRSARAGAAAGKFNFDLYLILPDETAAG